MTDKCADDTLADLLKLSRDMFGHKEEVVAHANKLLTLHYYIKLEGTRCATSSVSTSTVSELVSGSSGSMDAGCVKASVAIADGTPQVRIKVESETHEKLKNEMVLLKRIKASLERTASEFMDMVSIFESRGAEDQGLQAARAVDNTDKIVKDIRRANVRFDSLTSDTDCSAEVLECQDKKAEAQAHLDGAKLLIKRLKTGDK